MHYERCGHYPMREHGVQAQFDHDIEENLEKLCTSTPERTGIQAASIFKPSARSEDQAGDESSLTSLNDLAGSDQTAQKIKSS